MFHSNLKSIVDALFTMGGCISIEFEFTCARTTYEPRVQELLEENMLLENKNRQLRNEKMDITIKMELLEKERDKLNKILADQIKSSLLEEIKLTKDLELELQVCVVGDVLKQNKKLIETMQHFQIPIVYSSNGLEPIKQGDGIATIFILDAFEGEIFTCLLTADKIILGPTAILQLYNKDVLGKEVPVLPSSKHPMYTTSMENIVVTFSGFRSIEELRDIIELVRYMGGKVRREFSFTGTTHLVAKCNAVHGEKYKFASAADIPIMTVEWVQQAWARRRDVNCYATNEELMQYKMLPFVGCKFAFMGYQNAEEQHMIDICFKNGGKIIDPVNPQCTHIIVEDGFRVNCSKFNKSVWILNNEWFWTCVQMEVRVSENSYKFQYKYNKEKT